MWHSNTNKQFSSKAAAFDWINTVTPEVDEIKLYCQDTAMYSKTWLGLFDITFQVYVKGKLPVEYYD